MILIASRWELYLDLKAYKNALPILDSLKIDEAESDFVCKLGFITRNSKTAGSSQPMNNAATKPRTSRRAKRY